MRKLYEELDLVDVITTYILPCLAVSVCRLNAAMVRKGYAPALRACCRRLRDIVGPPPSFACKKVSIASRSYCATHCKAMPLYRHLAENCQCEFRGLVGFIHFRHNFARVRCGIFKERFLELALINPGTGRPATCCGGEGFALVRARWIENGRSVLVEEPHASEMEEGEITGHHDK